MKALAVVGLLLFISTVERSPWVLLAIALVGIGSWLVTTALAATEAAP